MYLSIAGIWFLYRFVRQWYTCAFALRNFGCFIFVALDEWGRRPTRWYYYCHTKTAEVVGEACLGAKRYTGRWFGPHPYGTMERYSTQIVKWSNCYFPVCVFLPPANEVCEGYVFTGVCPQGGWRAWCWGTCVLGGMRGGGGCAWCWGCAWCRGACVVLGGMRGIRRDTVNERAVRILLECILVF